MPAATHLIVTHLQELDLFPIPLAFMNGGTTIPLLSGRDQTTSSLVMDVLLQTVILCKKVGMVGVIDRIMGLKKRLLTLCY